MHSIKLIVEPQELLTLSFSGKVELVNKAGEKFDVMTENLKAAANVSVHSSYTHCNVQKANEKGKLHECWLIYM